MSEPPPSETSEYWLVDFARADEESDAPRGPEEFVEFSDSASPWDRLGEEDVEATFDVLYLVFRLEHQTFPSRLELHTFSYLACLMSVFKGQPASQWGYSFSAVPPTLPYSPAIEHAIADLVSAGFLLGLQPSADMAAVPLGPESHGVTGPTQYESTVEGREELKFLSSLHLFAPRVEFLAASSATALVLSTPAVVNSMTLEPELSRATRTDTTRMLLRGPSTGPLYGQFAALEQVLGSDHEDLIVPATLYVRFLSELARVAVERGGEVRSD